MLNKNGERELAYVVKVDAIEPIVGSDNCEAAIVGGWRVMVRKGTFKLGSLAIYFEIDSKVDTTRPEFAFLEKKGGKIKTQRYTFGGKGLMISQGLLMAPSDFGWMVAYSSADPNNYYIVTNNNGGVNEKCFRVDDESRFLTKELSVTYAETEDNARKGKVDPEAKYKSMAARHQKIFKKKWARWLMRRSWGKKLMFLFFGKKKDSPRTFPTHFQFIKKTDEERCENLPWVLGYERPLIVTEKLDGTSSTYILERKGKRKFEFYVCSRNVRQQDENQKCYHDHNIYWDMAFKYNIEEHLREYLEKNPNCPYVCIQGEAVGSVQGNPLNLAEDDLYCFNFIDGCVGRVDSITGQNIVTAWGMKWVPILDTNYMMPTNMEEFKQYATAKSVVNPDVLREGVVLRDPTNDFSFKNVSREYLLKHNG